MFELRNNDKALYKCLSSSDSHFSHQHFPENIEQGVIGERATDDSIES